MPDETFMVNEVELEIEVEAEIRMAGSSHPEEEIGEDPASWAFDPTEVEREEIGLRNILGAVSGLESDARFTGLTSAPGDLPAG